MHKAFLSYKYLQIFLKYKKQRCVIYCPVPNDRTYVTFQYILIKTAMVSHEIGELVQAKLPTKELSFSLLLSYDLSTISMIFPVLDRNLGELLAKEYN